MEKSNKPLLVGIIIVLALAVVYLLVTRTSQNGYDDLGNTDQAPQAATDSGESMDEAGESDAPAPNFMQPQLPPALTEAQKAELKAGSEEHAPKDLTFNITGGSFYYAPNEIRVKEGDKVKIVFTNAGGTHNLILPGFGVETKTIQTGQTDTIEFTADKKGTFEFYCSVGNGYHRQMGQIGVLLVE